MPIESDRIRHIDVYGKKKPCELFQNLLCSKEETSIDHVNYFFAQLKKKSASVKSTTGQLSEVAHGKDEARVKLLTIRND